ncbi:MAG: 5-bromo-4-chloroindolyl phosphate hydrolysis family protein [Opitutaceae bacterium]|nr:5-bromo-4-chloroindolyl phosphate hydrolysis family protein [Verrucomicrobiales bacterium]
MSTTPRELIKGLGSGAGFLLFAFALDVPMLVAAGIAAGIYFGLSLMLPLPQPVEDLDAALGLTLQERDAFLASCRKSTGELAQLAAAVRNRAFGENVNALAKAAADLTSYLEKKPDAILLAYSVPRNLEHLAGMLRQYVAISTHQQASGTAEEALRKVEGIFESAGHSFLGMYQQLLDNDVAALETSAQTLAILMDVDTQIHNQRIKPSRFPEPDNQQAQRRRLPEKET